MDHWGLEPAKVLDQFYKNQFKTYVVIFFTNLPSH